MSPWPPYAIPLARMPVLTTADGQSTRPHIVRIVQGQGLRQAIEQISYRSANAPHMLKLGAVAFGYCPDAFHPPSSILVFEPDLQPDGEKLWLVRKMAAPESMEDLHVRPSTSPHMMRMWAERNSWMWFLFDVLGIEAEIMSSDVQSLLIVPDLHQDSIWDTIQTSSFARALDEAQGRLTEGALELERMQDALTYGPRSEAWETYLHFYGEAPQPVQVDILSSQLKEWRKAGLLAADQILELWAQGTLGHHDFSTIHPVVKTRFKFPFKDWSVIGVGLDNELRWTVHRSGSRQSVYLTPTLHYHEPLPIATSGSTKGPMQALAQAGLHLPNRDFDHWLDANLLEGQLLYDDEAYRLLGVEPPFYPEPEFRVWAQGLGLDG